MLTCCFRTLVLVLLAFPLACSHTGPSADQGEEFAPDSHALNPNRPISGHLRSATSPSKGAQNPAPTAERADEAALIRAVEKVGGKSIEGQYNPEICEQTRAYAKKMAKQGSQDKHAGSPFRFASARIGNGSEITAESEGSHKTMQEHADFCVYAWTYGGPGTSHYAPVMNPSDRFCYSMACRGSECFCAGLFEGSGYGSSSHHYANQPRRRTRGSQSKGGHYNSLAGRSYRRPIVSEDCEAAGT